MKKPRKKKARGRTGLLARVPLPKKTGKRHADLTKYHRQRERARLRRELETG